ncbi:Putative zinc-finger [Flexibacter flexilis DSM 6793]|uniref:Putative zinc-finger n=1 Tax=Flexibacter flexilis DSM 6793 TaxID=927664 RepID=A0A1I1H998_9BACT|nr:zf-HC2 domain-containing protein [Flexibacter flexilis]SFC20544.1 Putative zinc-finger [Flexibacter flexilis DSM 6793]
MGKILNTLLLSCEKATQLIDRKALQPLSWRESVQLQMHLATCKGCKAYQKQSQLIDQMLSVHFGQPQPDQVPAVENAALKKRIKKDFE